MKTKLLIIILSLLYARTQAQVQFKIADPTTQQGIAELKKAEFYSKQLASLGFTDKDVTIKTYPLRKFYSDVAGPVTKSFVEANRAEFYLEATTKKNAKGVIYKMEGYIVFARNDVAADQWGSYNAKFNNVWNVYHLNVANFLPANQKYIVDPEVVKKMLYSALTKRTIEPKFLSAPYNGYFNDIIKIENITYADEKMVENGEGVGSEMINASEQRYGFLWDVTWAQYSPDSGYIFEINQSKSISSVVTVKILNGEPVISNCYFYNQGIEKKLYLSERNGPKAYDTLFGGLSWVGADQLIGKKKVVSTDVLTGDKMKQFIETFANQFKKIDKNTTETELEQLFKDYICSHYLKKLVSSSYEALKKGFIPKVNVESGGYNIVWIANTRTAKKTSIQPALIHNTSLANIKRENGKYKYNYYLEFQ